jgi:hypothetical protein
MPDGMPFGFARGRGGGGPQMPFTYDGYTRDSTGAFYIGELERLDQTIHEPLYSVTWGRDIDIRDDITTGDEVASFTNSKTPQPLFLWGMELSYTMPELASAMQVGRPIDTQKYDVIRVKHQMDIDQMVYTGDGVIGAYGLLNHPSVTNVSNVVGGTWSAAMTGATPDVLLAQVNELLASVWAASGWAVMPTELRVPPTQFGLMVANKVSTAGNISVLRFLQENSLSNSQNGRPLNIQPLKWLVNRGAGNSQRMLAYTKEKNRVRYPMTPLQRTPLEWRSLYNLTTYWGRLGMIEVVYPETIGYRDGI